MIDLFTNEPHIRLKIIREALAISRKDFAKILDISYRRYTRWEKVNTTLPVGTQQCMVKLGLNPFYVLGDPMLTINDIPFENVKKAVIRELFNRSEQR